MASSKASTASHSGSQPSGASQSIAIAPSVSFRRQEIERTWRRARESFLEAYEEERRTYEMLSETVKSICTRLLEGKKLHQSISSRVKDPQSLQVKVDKSISTFLEEESQNKDARSLKDEDEVFRMLDDRIADRAGVRILVYYPNDVSRIAKLIRDCEQLQVMKTVVSYSKNREDYRKEDSTKLSEDGLPNYSYGAWAYKTVDTEEVLSHWKHSGYRAAHLHVMLKSGEECVANIAAALDANKTPGKKKETGTSTSEDLFAKAAEIQITTVVMHAWSEVEHDIFYKMAPDMVPDPQPVNRMLDGINGLSITTEIMLEELERNRDEAESQLERMYQNAHITSVVELQKWLQSTYLGDVSVLCWNKPPLWTSTLLMVSGYGPGPTRTLYMNCLAPPAHLKFLPSGSQKLDISLILLHALSRTRLGGMRWSDDPSWEICDLKSVKAFETWFRRQFMVAIFYDLMILLEGQAGARDLLKRRFQQEFDKFTTAQAIFTEFQAPVREWDSMKRLDTFACSVLESDFDLCDTYGIALTLARHTCLPVLSDSTLRHCVQSNGRLLTQDLRSWLNRPSSTDNNKLPLSSAFLSWQVNDPAMASGSMRASVTKYDREGGLHGGNISVMHCTAHEYGRYIGMVQEKCGVWLNTWRFSSEGERALVAVSFEDPLTVVSTESSEDDDIYQRYYGYP